jgi:hypothetical protein
MGGVLPSVVGRRQWEAPAYLQLGGWGPTIACADHGEGPIDDRWRAPAMDMIEVEDDP